MVQDTRSRTLKLRNEIYQLYCVEGKSLNHISKLYNLPRKSMTVVVKNELCYLQIKKRQTSSRIQGLVSKHKEEILRFCRGVEYRQLTPLLDKLSISRSEFRSMKVCDKNIADAVYTFNNKTSLHNLATERRLEKEAEWAKDLVDLHEEVWRDVVGYEGIYWVSNMARIKSRVKILKYTLNETNGRHEIRLSRDGEGSMFKFYRLVALSFIPNPENLPTVNHKDGDCTNDMLYNLEWSSYQDQNLHRIYVLKRPIAKAYKKNGKFKSVVVNGEYEFKTLVATAEFLGVSETTIQRYLSGESRCKNTLELVY